MGSKTRVLFVCLGNICRSPTAEAVFRDCVERAGLEDSFDVDSAGTGDWHVGGSPDARMQDHARRRGFDLSELRARQATIEDFHAFDWIVAMDRTNHRELEALRPAGRGSRLELMSRFFPEHEAELDVPDPYYGGERGFERVLDLLEHGCACLLEALRAEA
jgi:protein-tyrosine phosphatase